MPFSKRRIDTGPEGSLLCILAGEKRPKCFTCYGDILKSCTRHFVPMFVPMKNFRVHPRAWERGCTPGWRHMQVKFRTKYRLRDPSDLVSILCSTVDGNIVAYQVYVTLMLPKQHYDVINCKNRILFLRISNF